MVLINLFLLLTVFGFGHELYVYFVGRGCISGILMFRVKQRDATHCCGWCIFSSINGKLPLYNDAHTYEYIIVYETESSNVKLTFIKHIQH